MGESRVSVRVLMGMDIKNVQEGVIYTGARLEGTMK